MEEEEIKMGMWTAEVRCSVRLPLQQRKEPGICGSSTSFQALLEVFTDETKCFALVINKHLFSVLVQRLGLKSNSTVLVTVREEQEKL